MTRPGRTHLWLACAGLAALALAAGPAHAATYNVTARDDGADSWFEVEGLPGRNPRIPLEPGESVTVHFRNGGTVEHDLIFDEPVLAGTRRLPPGGTQTLEFDLPADFRGATYLCHPHLSEGMKGRAGPAGKDAAGLAVPLLACGLVAAALAGRWR